MMTVTKKAGSTSRSYRSGLRDQQARLTHSAVLTAAATCFVENGYTATTMKDIAALAGVSVETVYGQGGKASLLLKVVDRVLVGDDEPVPAMERPPIQAMLIAPDVHEAVTLLRAILVTSLPAALPVLHAFEQAAGADPDIAAAHRTYEERRLADMSRIAQSLEPGLRPGVALPLAADVLWMLLDPAAAHALVVDRGWGVERWADWVTDSIRRLLLA
jgi:AcrR family transcriptional regulator